MNATIFALATAPGRAAVAVIRLSGPGVEAALQALAVGPPPPRRASLRTLRAADGASLDDALVLWMPSPRSFTGEDCAELHVHGGTAVVTAVSHRLLALGLQPAEPGEFTRRAFENGRIDLVQAEAVTDLVDAETEAQRLQALAQLGGAASAQHGEWRDALLSILAELEAAVDFPDEDLPDDLAARTRPRMQSLAQALAAAGGDRRGENVREGFRVALVGEPNAGKSSLFNALLNRDAAIVTAVPGTTRDVIEAPLVLGGRKVVLADLAGLRDTDDPVEQEGVRRARAWASSADLRLSLSEPFDTAEGATIRIQPKADLEQAHDRLNVSSATGEGVNALMALIEERAIAATTGDTAPAATRERHRLALLRAAAALQEASAQAAPELAAEGVRLATREMERISGRIDAEAVLDRVFSSFCIGK